MTRQEALFFFRGLRGAAVCALLAAAAGCGGSGKYKPSASAHNREQMEQRIARVLAEEALGAAGKPARVAVIRAGPDTNFGDEHNRIMAVLGATLQAADVPVVEWVLAAQPRDPNVGDEYAPLPAEVTGPWLAAKLPEASDVAVIISLADAPVGDPASLPKKLPPIVCLAATSGQGVPPMMRAGVVRAAIVPRRGSVPEKEKDWFNIRYTLVRPDTLAAWEQGQPPPK